MKGQAASAQGARADAAKNPEAGKDAFSERLGSLAGLGTWLAVGTLPLLELIQHPASLLEPRWLLWLGAYFGFGLVFALDAWKRLGAMSRLALLTLLAALAILALPGYGFTAILFIITASLAAHAFELRGALAWVVAQTAFAGGVTALTFASPTVAGVQTLAYFGFQLFALVTTHSALKEAAARQALARQSAELRATQALLAQSSRVGERVRIARELHDLIGHHLTALSLNLEVAEHLLGNAATRQMGGDQPNVQATSVQSTSVQGVETATRAREHVHKARALAKLLLADVREVVSSMREGGDLALADALTALAADVPGPKVHLALPEDLRVNDLARAQVIVRCVQEVITNAVKHADAANLWITLVTTPEGVRVHARDDGRGSKDMQAGNGLLGMRERFEGFGGTLEVLSAPGQGFRLDAWLPGLEARASR